MFGKNSKQNPKNQAFQLKNTPNEKYFEFLMWFFCRETSFK